MPFHFLTGFISFLLFCTLYVFYLFRLSLVLDPLFGESVGDGQQDRAFDIAEGAGGSQHGRGDGPTLPVASQETP